MALQARFYDGIQSRPITVTLAVSQTSLRLTPEAGGDPVLWKFTDIVILDRYNASHPGRLSAKHMPDARLLLDTEAGWRAISPHLQQAKNQGEKLSISLHSIVMFAVLAGLLIAAAIYYVPRGSAHLAVFVPDSVADRMGRQLLLVHFNSPVCVDPAGLAAYEKLQSKIEDGLLWRVEYKPLVVQHKESNAFAMPGNYVAMFDGLLNEATSVDEAAGVFAHELGHVHYNHSMRSMMRYLGFSFILKMMVGDSGVVDAVGIISVLRFSREDEEAADDFAIDVLQRAGGDVARFGDFFERHADEDSKMDVMQYISTHPASDERAKSIRARAQALPEGAAPLLTADEWKNLQNICAKTIPMGEWLDAPSQKKE